MAETAGLWSRPTRLPCRAVGVDSTPGIPASQRVPPPAVPISLLVASSCRRRTLCFSAQASQRVWFGIACLRQSLQIPSSLALSRWSLAALLEASLRSGSDCLWASRPPCSSGVLSTFGGETFFSGLGFGSDLGLVFPGFVNRRRSPGFSRVGVDEGLLARSYLLLNLAGSGTRSRKVAPTARVWGPGTQIQYIPAILQAGPYIQGTRGNASRESGLSGWDPVKLVAGPHSAANQRQFSQSPYVRSRVFPRRAQLFSIFSWLVVSIAPPFVFYILNKVQDVA